jgi:hypothetical protein
VNLDNSSVPQFQVDTNTIPNGQPVIPNNNGGGDVDDFQARLDKLNNM